MTASSGHWGSTQVTATSASCVTLGTGSRSSREAELARAAEELDASM